MASPARFARAIMMVRGTDGVHKAVHFYNQALGLRVVRHTDEWAELTCGRGVLCLHVQAVMTNNEAQLSVGYSPFLSFDVDNMDATIRTCAQMGAHLDGPIQYPAHGKVAAMRTPDGHMIGLYEPADL